MGIKVIGSFLIIFVSVISSFYYEKHQKEKQNNLREICDFLEYIKAQIEHFSKPLKIIYEQYGKRNQTVYALITSGNIKGFSEKTDNELNKCFKLLGKGYKTEQIKTLEYTITQTKEELTKIEKEYSQKTKVFRAMAIFIGCSVIILLV